MNTKNVKKTIFTIIIGVLLIPTFVYTNEKINIFVNKEIIDTTKIEYNSKILFPGYFHNRYDLFKIDFSDDININKHESKIIIKSENSHNYKKLILDRKPKILDFLIEKIGKNKIKETMDNGHLHIIGDTNKTGSNYHDYSSEYYLGEKNNGLEGQYLDIRHKYEVYNQNNKNIKITLSPFDKEIFLGNRIGNEGPYPFLSIFDNSLLPQNLKLVVNKKIYYPKIKYNIQGYKINTPYPLETEKLTTTKISYVFIPYYEFNIEPFDGKNIIEIDYLKYINNNDEIIIQEIY